MKKTFFFLFFFINVPVFFAQPILLDSTYVDTSTIATNLETVWELIYGYDGDLWYTERVGRVGKVNPVTKQKTTLLQISNVYEDAANASEAGLLGMVLHPNMVDTPHVYLVYNYLSGNVVLERLVKYTYTGSSLINPVIILDNLPGEDYHDGSRLIITPDRKIIMTTGDATDTNLPQNNSSRNGKFLRMNLDGTVPNDNPISNSFVWAKGSRNAQGLVLASNGKLYSSEHGPNSDDEINIVSSGDNLGWPTVKGLCNSPIEIQFCTDSSVTEPIKVWTPTVAPGGLDYYSLNTIPEFENSLLLVTLKEKDLRVLKLNANGTTIVSEKVYFDNMFHRIRDLCVSPTGDVYIGSSNYDGRAQAPFPIATDDRIIKIKNSGINTSVLKKNDMGAFVYPNPITEGVLTFNAGTEQVDFKSIAITTIYGQMIETNCRFLDKNKIEIKIKNEYCEGIYFLNYKNMEGNGKVLKIIAR